jgi:hypothetical protein
MKNRYRNYRGDDWKDTVIGYWHDGNVTEAPKPAAPPLTPGMHGGTHASYILQMAREGGEFTVKELTQRFGLGHQGAYFYEVLNSLIDAGLIERRIGKMNTAFLRGTEEVTNA